MYVCMYVYIYIYIYQGTVPEALEVGVGALDEGPRDRGRRDHAHVVLVDHAAPAAGVAPVGHLRRGGSSNYTKVAYLGENHFHQNSPL